MTNRRPWPTRDEWAAEAERFARTICLPRERVGEQLSDWATPEQREALREAAREARSALHRVMKLADYEYALVGELAYEANRVSWVQQAIGEIVRAHGNAATEATERAVADQIAFRNSEEGWQHELERRRDLDERGAGVVKIHRATGGDAA